MLVHQNRTELTVYYQRRWYTVILRHYPISKILCIKKLRPKIQIIRFFFVIFLPKTVILEIFHNHFCQVFWQNFSDNFQKMMPFCLKMCWSFYVKNNHFRELWIQIESILVCTELLKNGVFWRRFWRKFSDNFEKMMPFCLEMCMILM